MAYLTPKRLNPKLPKPQYEYPKKPQKGVISGVLLEARQLSLPHLRLFLVRGGSGSIVVSS